MEITTIAQAKENIEKWLNENHHKINSIKDDEASNFHFEVDFPVGTKKRQHIIQPLQYPSMILILSGVSVASDHTEILKKMKEDERDVFYSEITKETIFLENSYDMNADDSGVITQIQFSYEFYFDELTKTRLYKGLLLNHKSLLYVVYKFNDKFGMPVMPQSEESLDPS